MPPAAGSSGPYPPRHRASAATASHGTGERRDPAASRQRPLGRRRMRQCSRRVPAASLRPRRSTQSVVGNRHRDAAGAQPVGDATPSRIGPVDADRSIHDHCRRRATDRAATRRATAAGSLERGTTATPSPGANTTTKSGGDLDDVTCGSAVRRQDHVPAAAQRRSLSRPCARVPHRVDACRRPPRRTDEQRPCPPASRPPPHDLPPHLGTATGRSSINAMSSSMHSSAAETSSAAASLGPRTVPGPDLDDDVGHGGSLQAT